MSKKKIWLLLAGISIVASLTVSGLMALRSHPSSTSSDPTEVTKGDVEEGMGDLPPEDPTPMPAPAAIQFNDTLVIMDHQYSVDGGPMVEANCSKEDPPFTFATIDVGGGKLVELTCLDDYGGGISVRVQSEPPLYEKVALKLSDSGSWSDERSWIKKTAIGITITKVNRWSQEDVDPEEGGNSHVECGANVDQITVSSKNLSWAKTDGPGKGEGFVFNPPPEINAKCL